MTDRSLLQHNLVSSVAAVSGMAKLRHVDMSNNLLTTLTPLTSLVGLEQLCVDSNRIGDLTALSGLSGLMELYAAHNTLSSMTAFVAISELPKLFVVDFRGNGMAMVEDYHQYAVFRLRRLCVLDGETVSAAQQAAARSKFVGRLTMEFLEERAPGTRWSSCASSPVTAQVIKWSPFSVLHTCDIFIKLMVCLQHRLYAVHTMCHRGHTPLVLAVLT